MPTSRERALAPSYLNSDAQISRTIMRGDGRGTEGSAQIHKSAIPVAVKETMDVVRIVPSSGPITKGKFKNNLLKKIYKFY